MDRGHTLRGAAAAAPRTPLPTAAGVIVLVGALVAGSYALRSMDRPVTRARDASGRAVAETSAGGAVAQAPSRSNLDEIERLIRAVEQRVARAPNATDLTFLGRLYIEKGRLTGDVSTYARARTALRRSLRIFPSDTEAGALLATTAYTLHDFGGARARAREILDRDPGAYDALAVAADASLELGDVAGARADYARLDRALPGVGAIDARRARLAWLTGDTPLARSLAFEAEKEARASGAFGAGLAWYRSLRGLLELEAGRYTEAVRLYRGAVRMAPRYPVAIAGLARSLAAGGRRRAAIASYERAIDLVPQPDYLAALGDLYRLEGERDSADGAYATVEAIARLERSRGNVYGRQIVLFHADHRIRTAGAVRNARAELAIRRDIYAFDALAWALYADGRYTRADRVIRHALRLGTRDARLLYHGGMISARAGDRDRARSLLSDALGISPNFDPLQARRARRTLRVLEAGR